MDDTAYRYEIEPRPAELGGGWRLRLFAGEKEMGGGVFPPAYYGPDCDSDAAEQAAYADAWTTGKNWLASRERG